MKLSGKNILLIIISISFTLFAGCLQFGEEVSTDNPTQEQVAFCKSTLFLNDDIELTPIGYKLNATGIDDALWFKFSTKTKDPKKIFKEELIDSISFSDDYKFPGAYAKESWWDIKGKKVYGGQVELPSGTNFMEVGIPESDTPGEYIIYIFWFEV